uniref:Uncharacterized protein n=1 Tax=Panagrolaimus sp. ES5 TaxID=591445 RepID=A0AC34GQT2_9BILA
MNDMTWRKQFLQLSFPVNFVPMANPMDPAAVRSQLSALTESTSTIVFVAKTHNVENYILFGEEFIVRNMFTWVQLALDTLPFKCDDCIATEMYVVRALPTGKVEDLRLLNDYIISQELNIDMNYSIKSYQEAFISTAFDSIKLAFLYLIADNSTLVSLLTPEQKLQFEGIGPNKTMFDIISLQNINYEYGQYVHHFKSYFYQIGNWTFINGVTSFYGSLIVDVRQINHYRVVTVIQQPFVEYVHGGSVNQFQGYCIDLLNLIQQELQFTYEIYQAPDGKFGSVDDNGNWNGLIGEVVIGKADIALAPLSVMAERGGEAPKNVSGRLVAATWWLFGFIIIASYTANLAAFLTVSRLEQSINSLDDLAKQYKVEYAPIKGGATETYFRRMAQIEELLYNTWKAMSLNESMTPLERAKLAVWDYPVSDKFTNMWRYMQESKLPDGIPQAIDRVLNSDTGFAFIGDAMEIKYAILTNCKLQQVGTEFSRKPYAIAVQSGSGLKDEISATILKLLNERQLEALKEKWWNDNPHKVKCPDVDDESNGISIQNIGGVFIVILAGIVLSFITLIFEYMYYKRKGHKNLLKRTNARHSTEMTTASSSETQDQTTTTATRNRFTLHNGNIPQYTNSAFQF